LSGSVNIALKSLGYVTDTHSAKRWNI
jgi:hypothetical protein